MIKQTIEPLNLKTYEKKDLSLQYKEVFSPSSDDVNYFFLL